MKKLYVKILEAKDSVTDETLRNFKANFTCYYNGRLLIPLWADYKAIHLALIPYMMHINVYCKWLSEEETKELWEFHPELWIRKPEIIDYSKVTK